MCELLEVRYLSTDIDVDIEVDSTGVPLERVCVHCGKLKYRSRVYTLDAESKTGLCEDCACILVEHWLKSKELNHRDEED